MQNKRKREDSDLLYIEKSKLEYELQTIEYDTNKIMQTIEMKLMDLEPEQKIEYEHLREENQNYIIKINEVKEELLRINQYLNESENLLKNNPNKKEAHKIRDLINSLLRKKEELELQVNDVRKLYILKKGRIIGRRSKGASSKKIQRRHGGEGEY